MKLGVIGVILPELYLLVVGNFLQLVPGEEDGIRGSLAKRVEVHELDPVLPEPDDVQDKVAKFKFFPTDKLVKEAGEVGEDAFPLLRDMSVVVGAVPLRDGRHPATLDKRPVLAAGSDFVPAPQH
jgi:hypothetical protein